MESENERTIASLEEKVAILEKIVVEAYSNSEKSSKMSEKSQKSLRILINKCNRKIKKQ